MCFQIFLKNISNWLFGGNSYLVWSVVIKETENSLCKKFKKFQTVCFPSGVFGILPSDFLTLSTHQYLPGDNLYMISFPLGLSNPDEGVEVRRATKRQAG